MAFCNSCGANLSEGAKFCNKCGTPISAPPAASPAAMPPTAAKPSGGGGALKVVLLVVGAIILIGAIGIASLGFFAWRVARRTHVRQQGDNVNVETPFGSVRTSKDPDQAAKDLGIDIYPGAQVQKSGASSTTFGGVHSAAATFESSDSLDKVCGFYKSKFPNAMVSTSDQNHCTIVSNDNQNMVTINIEADGSATKFQITNVSKKSTSSN